MFKKLYLVLFLIITSLTNISFAQQAGINFSLAFPQGEFGEEVDNLGYGLSGEFMFLSPKPLSPFGIGVNLGYYVYGRESSRVPWSSYIQSVFLDVEKTNNLVNFHILFEIGFPTGVIRPYVQGLFGGEYLYTESSVSGENGQEVIASSTNYDDWAWSYGAGGGIEVLLGGDPVTEMGAIYLDLKGRYLFGSETTYLKEGDMYVEQGELIYSPSKSKTDMITAHIGVRVALNFAP
ncbi:MAG: hypothetical protein IPH97_02325 [Ignavibacteriales bacterium]|nr:hypothetical protein [Ignavibacteriales bacterium]